MTSFVSRGGYWVVAQGCLFLAGLALPLVCGDLLSWPEQGSSVRMVTGGVIAAVGFGLIGTGAAALGSSLTPLPTPNGKSQLRTTGVFRLVRHPIYGGIILAFGGYGLGARSVLGLLIPLAMLLFFDRKASLEERLLERAFPDYPQYRKLAHKLIPWIY